MAEFLQPADSPAPPPPEPVLVPRTFGLSATWSGTRDLPEGLLTREYPALHQAVVFRVPRTLLYAVTALFELVAGTKAQASRIDHQTDSMGGSRTDLELEAGTCRLVLQAGTRLGDSWQRVEAEAGACRFDGPPGLEWTMSVEMSACGSLELSLTGLGDAQVSAAEDLLDRCFDSRTWDLSASQVASRIHQLQSGGYNEYHEWEPDVSLSGRIDALAGLLDAWYGLEPAGRDLVLALARRIAADEGPWPGRTAGVLLAHRGKPAVAGLMVECLASGAFCRDLLRAARQTALPAEWLESIRQRVRQRGFSEPAGSVNLGRLYREVKSLLNSRVQ